ncbi:MAG: TVP38/TMEM64 family protein [Burkholderiaceae bacterium]
MILLSVSIGTLVLWRTGMLNQLLVSNSLEQTVTQLGQVGPLLVIALMAIAIVMTPIPSAPIALASGAAYGHLWGTVYIVLGCLIGASVAFTVSRLLGQNFLLSRIGKQIDTSLFKRFIASQNAMTIAVFATRLMPFLSFDIVSYAAGLTSIKAWRFALATLFGLLPSSFALAHFGAELGTGDMKRASITILALGMIVLLPFAWAALPKRLRAAIAQALPFSTRNDPHE